MRYVVANLHKKRIYVKCFYKNVEKRLKRMSFNEKRCGCAIFLHYQKLFEKNHKFFENNSCIGQKFLRNLHR